jgi:hypothetical protein
MAKKKKAVKKKRTKKEDTLAVKGSFADLIKVAANPPKKK